MKDKTSVSVILVSYNNEKHIKDCLNSLKKQTYKNFNIIFVDNNSQDKSIKIAKRFKKIKIIKNKENYGFAKGNNIGIKKAFKNKKTKYIVCLNIDTITDKNWLKELVKIAEKYKNIGSIQSKVLLYNKKDKINTTGNDINFLGIGICKDYLNDSKKENKIKEIGYASGSSVLYSRNALKKTGLYDADYFMYKEDLDLGWRLRLKGYKNLLAPKSIVYHKYNFSKSSQKFYYIERNRLIVLLKNYSIKSLTLIFPIAVLFEFGILLYSIKERFFLEKLKSYRDFLISIPKTLKKRKKIQKERKIKDKEIVKSFIAKIEFEEIKNKILYKFANPIIENYWKIILKAI